MQLEMLQWRWRSIEMCACVWVDGWMSANVGVDCRGCGEEGMWGMWKISISGASKNHFDGKLPLTALTQFRVRTGLRLRFVSR